jgi:hypothetical protein
LGVWEKDDPEKFSVQSQLFAQTNMTCKQTLTLQQVVAALAALFLLIDGSKLPLSFPFLFHLKELLLSTDGTSTTGAFESSSTHVRTQCHPHIFNIPPPLRDLLGGGLTTAA